MRRFSLPKHQVRPNGAVGGRLLISTEPEPSKSKKSKVHETKEICGHTKRLGAMARPSLWITWAGHSLQLNVILGKSSVPPGCVLVRPGNHGKAPTGERLTAMSRALQTLGHDSVSFLRRAQLDGAPATAITPTDGTLGTVFPVRFTDGDCTTMTAGLVGGSSPSLVNLRVAFLPRCRPSYVPPGCEVMERSHIFRERSLTAHIGNASSPCPSRGDRRTK